MGNRLTKIYTKTGDQGTTGLGNGHRVAKDDVRVEAYGTIDELNSALGVLISSKGISHGIITYLTQIQHELFDIGSELCLPEYVSIQASHVEELENWLESINEQLLPLKEFILPGGTFTAATCHLARTICRRAERRVVTLAKLEPVSQYILSYLNRLSDLLFVIARIINLDANCPEILWKHERTRT